MCSIYINYIVSYLQIKAWLVFLLLKDWTYTQAFIFTNVNARHRFLGILNQKIWWSHQSLQISRSQSRWQFYNLAPLCLLLNKYLPIDLILFVSIMAQWGMDFPLCDRQEQSIMVLISIKLTGGHWLVYVSAHVDP